MRVNSKVTINRAKIRQLNQAAIIALEQTGEALHKEIQQAQVVPRKDGTLQGEGMFVDTSKSNQGKVSIVSSTPYARRLYYHPEYKFHKEKWKDSKRKEHNGNPNAKGHWFEDWQKGGKYENFCEKTFKRLYRGLGGL